MEGGVDLLVRSLGERLYMNRLGLLVELPKCSYSELTHVDQVQGQVEPQHTPDLGDSVPHQGVSHFRHATRPRTQHTGHTPHSITKGRPSSQLQPTNSCQIASDLVQHLKMRISRLNTHFASNSRGTTKSSRTLKYGSRR